MPELWPEVVALRSEVLLRPERLRPEVVAFSFSFVSGSRFAFSVVPGSRPEVGKVAISQGVVVAQVSETLRPDAAPEEMVVFVLVGCGAGAPRTGLSGPWGVPARLSGAPRLQASK